MPNPVVVQIAVLAVAAFLTGGAARAQGPRLEATIVDGYLSARAYGIPDDGIVEFRLRSDRNAAISHSAEIAPHDPRGLTTQATASHWYPVVDVALVSDLEGLATFEVGSGGGGFSVNGMFHTELGRIEPEVRVAADRLLQWENTIAVEPAARLTGFRLAVRVGSVDGCAERSFRLLSPHWSGEVEAHLVQGGTERRAVHLSVSCATEARAAVAEDALVALRDRGLAPERLVASLEATLGFLLRMRDESPGAPTAGGLNLFYDHAARMFRRPHWVWSWGPSVRLFLDAAAAGPDTGAAIDPVRLRSAARKIGHASRRFQLNEPGDPVDGVIMSRWRESSGDLARGAGFECFYSVADALFMVGWGWMPLYQETGDRQWLDDSMRLVLATERLLGTFEIIPMDYVRPPGRWKNYTIDEAGFGPEGLAAVHAATGDVRVQRIGGIYMDRMRARFTRPDGSWARRFEFSPERTIVAPRITRGAGWAMEGLIATFFLTRDDKYLSDAVRLAAHLQAGQQPDGGWPFELDQPVERVGVGEKATALWCLLFYRLHAITRDPAHLETARRALGWCLDHQYAGPDLDGHGGIIGITFQSGVTYRAWFPLACSYASAFFGLAVLEELKVQGARPSGRSAPVVP